MKIVGYCALGAIALALFIAMCAILRDSIITHDISVRGQGNSGAHITDSTTAATISTKEE